MAKDRISQQKSIFPQRVKMGLAVCSAKQLSEEIADSDLYA
jgi:hypothetical protein